MLITWFGLGRGTNGRLPLTPIPFRFDISNTWSCRLAFQTPRRSSRHSSNDMLRDMVDRFVFVYLDDILIFSQNERDHVQHVRRVLQWLLKNRLFGGEVSVSRMVYSIPGFYSLAQRYPNRSRHGKSCCGLAHPRESHSGPAFSGVCQFLQAVHSEL